MEELFSGFETAILVVVLLMVAIILLRAVRIVPQATVLVIERLGKFHGLATSGLNIIFPLIDKPRAVYWTMMRPGLSHIDLREQFIDLPAQPVITRDNVTVSVDSIVYFQVTDPIKAVYEVADLTGSIIQLTVTAMRNVMGEMDLDHTLSSRDIINSKLRLILDEATTKWGVKITRVEVKNINPPEDIRITMEKQMTAERNRRALVLQAEGEKQAAIARAEGEKLAAIAKAEGEKESSILRAEGAAQARLRAAEAESEALRRITEAIGQFSDPAHYLITARYIDSLKEMAGSPNSKVIFMPVETASVMASVGALKEVLSEKSEKEALPGPTMTLRTPTPTR